MTTEKAHRQVMLLLPDPARTQPLSEHLTRNNLASLQTVSTGSNDARVCTPTTPQMATADPSLNQSLDA